MKGFVRDIVFKIITWQARRVLNKFNPTVIGVVGSVGKTTTKDAIYDVLDAAGLSVRANKKSLNSVIGAPLTILNLDTGWSNMFLWVVNICKGFKVMWFENIYPDFLVLELGIDAPGEMRQLAQLTQPDIVVFTVLPKVPVHMEQFRDAAHVIAEKKGVLDYIRKDGVVIYNVDDELSAEFSQLTYTTRTYGFGEAAEARAYDMKLSRTGTSFSVGNDVIQVSGVLGKQHVYPRLAARVVGYVLGIKGVDMQYAGEQTPGRMRILEGMNGSTLIDDTYNSSPVAMRAALEAVAQLEASQRVAILGHMAELGDLSQQEHAAIGQLCVDLGFDVLVTVGEVAQPIAETAQNMGLEAVYMFSDSEDIEIMDVLEIMIDSETVVLVKGSQGARMEKVSKRLLARPETAGHLLVRQEDAWRYR